MNYNIRCDISEESTKRVMKGIENRVGTHCDCASLVVVVGVLPFASEYEGQGSSWLPWNKHQNPSEELEIRVTHRRVGGAATTHVWHAAFGSFVSPTFPLFARDGRISNIPCAKVLDRAVDELDGHD